MAEPNRPMWDWFASWGAEPITFSETGRPDYEAQMAGRERTDYAQENFGHRTPGSQPGWEYYDYGVNDGFETLRGGAPGAATGHDVGGAQQVIPSDPAAAPKGKTRKGGGEHGGLMADHPNQPSSADPVLNTMAAAMEAVSAATHKTRSVVKNAHLRKKMDLPQETYTVVEDRDGKRHVVRAPQRVYNTLNDRDATEFLEKAKVQGTLPLLRQQLFYAGAYGDKTVNYGDEVGYTEDDKAAVKSFMEYANNAGGSVNELLPGLAKQGRRLGGPLGTSVDEADQPIYQINDYIDANGLEVSNDWVRRQMRGIGAGKLTVEQAIGELQKQVVAEFPAWEQQIKSGSTVRDLAAPYQKMIAKTLEVPLADVGVDDPLVRKGLQSVGDDGKPGIKPLWQFEQDLRKDKRWESTSAAWNEVGGMAEEVMRMFGMTP